jgi:hypothetical protein
MSKYLRVRRHLVEIAEGGTQVAEPETLSSINAAKRRSRELQKTGHTVRLAERLPPKRGELHR